MLAGLSTSWIRMGIQGIHLLQIIRMMSMGIAQAPLTDFAFLRNRLVERFDFSNSLHVYRDPFDLAGNEVFRF